MEEAVRAAFPNELAHRVTVAASKDDSLRPLFLEIADYVSSFIQEQSKEQRQDVQVSVSKKRKLDDDESATEPATQPDAFSTGLLCDVDFECKDVSVQIPVRKKMRLALVRNKQKEHAEVRLFEAATGAHVYSLPTAHIEDVFALPVPDKQARQAYFAVIPSPEATLGGGRPMEQLLFTLPETAPNTSQVTGLERITVEDTYVSLATRALTGFLGSQGKEVITPDPTEFSSSRPQPHRKGEKAYHVHAHRGSKEGYLYFLSNGIFFGFKKPLSFFPFSTISSISYTSVLQRTFNLVIGHTEADDADEVKEVEFSMLDQEDFAGIDDYIKRHGLNDASMAAERRAKAYNVNKPKMEANGETAEGAAAVGEDDDGQTELQKAEQQLQDEEDEEEEDYEDSGGESDGEGEYSEEEEEG